jgi:5-bromo-4-chloroindolyl phosphate hydrolysis protein
MENTYIEKPNNTTKKRGKITNYKNLGLTPKQILEMSKIAEVELEFEALKKDIQLYINNNSPEASKKFLEEIKLIIKDEVSFIKKELEEKRKKIRESKKNRENEEMLEKNDALQ